MRCGAGITEPCLCKWTGVQCEDALCSYGCFLPSCERSPVIGLTLARRNLTGSLPGNETWVSGLSYLTSLDLSSNPFLSGRIPAAWGDLASMKILNLAHKLAQHGKLSGPLPRQWGDMTALEELKLASNRLSGSLPKVSFGRMPGMRSWHAVAS